MLSLCEIKFSFSKRRQINIFIYLNAVFDCGSRYFVKWSFRFRTVHKWIYLSIKWFVEIIVRFFIKKVICKTVNFVHKVKAQYIIDSTMTTWEVMNYSIEMSVVVKTKMVCVSLYKRILKKIKYRSLNKFCHLTNNLSTQLEKMPKPPTMQVMATISGKYT